MVDDVCQCALVVVIKQEDGSWLKAGDAGVDRVMNTALQPYSLFRSYVHLTTVAGGQPTIGVGVHRQLYCLKRV